MNRLRSGPLLLGVALLMLGASCQAILGIEDLAPGAGSGGSTNGGGGGSSSSSAGGGPNCVACYPEELKTFAGKGACVRGCLDDHGKCQGAVTPAVEDCASAKVDDNCDGKAACSGHEEWTTLVETLGSDVTSTLAVDAAGDVLIAGQSGGRLAIDGKGLDEDQDDDTFAYVAKLSHVDGKPIWVKTFPTAVGGDSRVVQAHAVAGAPNGDVVVAGNFAGEFQGQSSPTAYSGYVMALRGDNGDIKWFSGQLARDQATDSAENYGVAVGGDGKIFVAGELTGVMTLENGQNVSAVPMGDNGYLLRLDAKGHVEKVKIFGSDGSSGADAIAVAPGSGDVAVGFDYIYGGFSIGSHVIPDSGADSLIFARFDHDLEPKWAVIATSEENVGLAGVAFDENERFIAAGFFAETLKIGSKTVPASPVEHDVFVTALDGDGKPVWLKAFGDSAEQYAYAVAVDAAGQIVVSGEFTGEFAFDDCNIASHGRHGSDPTDAYVMKLSPKGEGIWCQKGGSIAYDEYAVGVGVDPLGSVYQTSGFIDAFTIGGGKTVSCGNMTCSTGFAVSRLDP